MVTIAEEQNFGNLPQEITEAGLNMGGRTTGETASPELTGGDVDAAWSQAAMVGEEAVGGTTPTPDQNVVDELGIAVGLEMDDRADLRTTDILNERDDRRWELDPTSAEDYEERLD